MKLIGMMIMLALVLLSGTVPAAAQSNVSKEIRVKGIEDIAREQNPKLFLPKDEFETNDEYSTRLSAQRKLMAALKAELDARAQHRRAEKARMLAEQAAEAERMKKVKISESLAPASFTPSAIGSYNAERETFPLTVNGSVYTVKVPRGEARDFKEQYRAAKVEGYRQLSDNLRDYDYFNLVVTHPVTGSRFAFGPVKDIAAAPVILDKKSVVPPNLKMTVAFIEDNGNGFLDAEENGRIKVQIANSGNGSALGVMVRLEPQTENSALSATSSRIIGEIPAGQSREAEFSLAAGKNIQRQVNRFTVTVTESYGFPPDPAAVSFESYPFIPCELQLVDYGIQTPNANNEIRPQTTTTVQARVQNRGKGPAENVRFAVNLPKGVYFTPESKQNYSFLTLQPGEFKDLEFSFNTANTVGERVEVSIGFTEESTSGRFPLDLEVNKPQQAIAQLVVKGTEQAAVALADVATVSVDIEKDIPRGSRDGSNDLAVVFGIETYKNVPGVTFARRDAEWIKKYFEQVLGIPASRIYFKTDSDVTLAEFNVAFGGWLQNRLKKDSNVFIYYAGHGAPELSSSKAYLIPYDGNPNYPADTGFELEELYNQLGGLGARSVTVFLDACFSGANRNNEMLLAGARPVFIEVEAAAAGGVTVFSAAGGKEISSAWPEKKHGLFSYFLMKGMAGAADADGNKQITVGELGDFVRDNVSDMAGMLDRQQTPELQTGDRGAVLIGF